MGLGGEEARHLRGRAPGRGREKLWRDRWWKCPGSELPCREGREEVIEGLREWVARWARVDAVEKKYDGGESWARRAGFLGACHVCCFAFG